MARVENRLPKPIPEELLLRVCPNLQMKKFQTLKRRLRGIENGDGDLQMVLLAGYFLAWLSLKKTGRNHRMPKLSGPLGELERAVPKLALLSRRSEEIRRRIVEHEMPLELPDDVEGPDKYLFFRDVVLIAPEVFEAFRRGAETLIRKLKPLAHPLVEVDERLCQIETALRPFKKDLMYGHIYNSRWALTAKLVAAFGGSMTRTEIEKRTKRDGFISYQKRHPAPS